MTAKRLEGERLRDFVLTVTRFLIRAEPESTIAQQIERIDWKMYPIAGIRAAASDVIQWAQDLEGEELAELDAMLAGRGLPKLSDIRAKVVYL